MLGLWFVDLRLNAHPVPHRSEISGERLWGLFAKRFGSAENFFREHIVMNYCPLAFLEKTGRNRTPDKLPPREREKLFAACDDHLREVIRVLGPEWLIGVGDFAMKRAISVFHGGELPVQSADWTDSSRGELRLGQILHPSPASPASNKNWVGKVTGQLRALGVWD